MGAWLTEELCLDHEVCVYDSDIARMKYFIKVRRILDLAEVEDFDPEMVINCVFLGDTVEVFEQVLPYVGPDCILADIASVKTGLAEFYRAAGQPLRLEPPDVRPDLRQHPRPLTTRAPRSSRSRTRTARSSSRPSIRGSASTSSSTTSRATTGWSPTRSPRPSPPRWSSPRS